MKPTTAAALLLLTSAACSSGPTPAPAKTAPAVPLATARVELDSLPESFEAGGIVRARATAFVSSRVLAPIAQVRVQAGDRVRRGAPLVALDAREVAAEDQRAAAAALAAAEGVRAAEADLRAADSALQLANATHERMAGLAAKRSATPAELDQAVAGLRTAQAQRAAADARLAAAAAGRRAAQAAADAASVAAGYAVLTAPFDGIVTEVHADPGTMAVPGTPLVTLDDWSGFRLEVDLDESRASLVAPGQRAEVLTGAASSTWTAASVVEIARVDPESHGFRVKIDLPPGLADRSGVFGRARFAGPARRVLTVPASALVRRGQLAFVYLVDDERRARLRPVSAGAAAEGRIEILAGVRERDVVVASPPPALTDGTSIAEVRP